MPHQQPVLEITTGDQHRFELIHVPAQPVRATLLFLPGMGVTARHYIQFGLALSRLGIETFIHEWRGLGASSARASRRSDWGYRELLEEDLVAAIMQVQNETGRRELLIGGHSLGSQLACLAAAMQPASCAGLVIVAGGAPYWKAFSGWMRLGLPVIFRGMPAIANLVGHYPGRKLGFAGREARGVLRDWTASGRSGVYAPQGVETDLETRMRELTCPVLGLRMADDWFVPQSSLEWLTGKLGRAEINHHLIARDNMSGPADHYRWMEEPSSAAYAIADWADSIATPSAAAETQDAPLRC